MRCKKHPSDLSSGVGVCASCLRERLFLVMVAQAEKAEAELQKDCRRKENQQLEYPSFPRSVSPYVSRPTQHQRFFSTPMVGAAEIREEEKRRKRKEGKLSSLFFRLFRSKSDKADPVPGRGTDPVGSSAAPPSWFSTVVTGRLKKHRQSLSVDDRWVSGKRKACRNRDRGMSPARNSDGEENEHCRAGSSGHSSDSPCSWRQTPRRTPAAVRRGGTNVPVHSVHFGGINLCLSPLVRASPSRQCNPKGLLPEIISAGAESGAAARPRLSSAATLCKNRSRKLADFGRNNH